MKNLSLQDQLLQAGLVNVKKARQVRTEKRKQTKKLQKNKIEASNEAKLLLQQSKAQQQEKDKLLNSQRHEEFKKKQIANQITQLIDFNKLTKDDEGIAYHFTDQKKVKSIYLNADMRQKIISGTLAIVKSNTHYEVVPKSVAEKIKQLNDQLVVVLLTQESDRSEDHDYTGYEVPDDMVW